MEQGTIHSDKPIPREELVSNGSGQNLCQQLRQHLASRGLSVFALAVMASLLPTTAAAGQGDAQPRIEGTGKAAKLVLPAAMRDALASKLPGFEPWPIGQYSDKLVEPYRFNSDQGIFAVVGDFNGDGKVDVVIDGQIKNLWTRACVYSSNGGYQVINLFAERPRYVDMHTRQFLQIIKPGKYHSPAEGKPLDLKNEAFSESELGAGVTIYYFSNGKFAPFVMKK